ncbi:MAG: tetratricopeptide repeat protein [Phycisphaerae bacterium]|nr:tetratricopeptide repeat protein [Phycisphaerae bacterium]
MRGIVKFSVVLCVMGLAACAYAQTKTAAEYLQEGIFAQEIDSNPAKAVDLYSRVIVDPEASDIYKAQAMLRQGQCYVLLDQPDQAIKALKHLVQTFPGQTPVVDKARALLKDLVIVDPASLMPANTLAYVEVGNPGEQIETLLNMLQGTPLEASLNSTSQTQRGGGPQDIGQILQALRNPSMISEFKKVRGLAVGITGVPQNGPPPFVAVLFPGKSDALRGLLTVGLQIAAQPMDPIGGLQAYRVPGGPAAAFDDKALIVAFPESQLAGVIQQYTQAQTQTSLVKNRRFMSAAPVASRQQNALTVWVDAHDAYQKLMSVMPQDHMPGEFIIANMAMDLPSLDYATQTLSIQPDGIHMHASLNLKEGHQCLAYNMIHTPALTQAGFDAIPANAALVVSMALASPESAQAQAVQQKLQQLTGLDIGREIFANIEQISIFVIPGNEATPAYWSLPQIASQVGIAVTSHNPQKTRQFLNQWLSLGHAIVGQASGKPSAPKQGQYEIMLLNGQKICCYLDQINKTTVLGLSPGVIQQSRKAIEQKQNAYNSGPLSATFQALSPATSKLVLLNIGLAIEAVLPSMPNEVKNQLGPIAADLSKATANTVLQVNTEEGANQLGIHVGVNQLPKISDLLPSVMQLAEGMH